MPKIITVTQNSSKEGLYEKLKQISSVHGQTLQHFAGQIIDFAIKNKKIFNTPLEAPLRADGQPFTISIDLESKIKFKKWAAERQRTQSMHAVFVIEKYLMELINQGYNLNKAYDPEIEDTKILSYWRDDPLTQIADPILNVYFDPQLLSKDEISQVLIALNDVYRAMGGKELVVIDEQVGEFSYEPKNELV